MMAAPRRALPRFVEACAERLAFATLGFAQARPVCALG
jgi:hypothetical protein